MPAPATREDRGLQLLPGVETLGGRRPFRPSPAVLANEKQFAGTYQVLALSQLGDDRLVGRGDGVVECVRTTEFVGGQEAVVAGCRREPGKQIRSCVRIAAAAQCDAAPVAPFFGLSFGVRHQADIEKQVRPVLAAQAGSRAPAQDFGVLRRDRELRQCVIRAGQVVAGDPERDVAPGPQLLLERETMAARSILPQLRGEQRVLVGQALRRIDQLVAGRLVLAELRVRAQESFRFALRPQPAAREIDMLLIDGLAQPPRQRKLAGLDGEFEAPPVVGSAYQVVIGQVGKHGVAFVDLALADGPQTEGPLDDALLAPRLDLGTQGQAIQLRDLRALVELLINREKFGEPARLCQVQRVPVAEFSRGSQGAIALEEGLYRGVVGRAHGCPEPGGAEVGPKDVVLQRPPLVVAERFNNIPVAAFDVFIDREEDLSLAVDVRRGCRGRDRANSDQCDEKSLAAAGDGSD